MCHDCTRSTPPLRYNSFCKLFFLTKKSGLLAFESTNMLCVLNHFIKSGLTVDIVIFQWF